ncbi:hypothetical protein AAZX31_18G075400 [Glycine max]|uniref:Transmembrane protein n=3 Tax=Glycine subgen. Soja TaxID=1462606 RepID=A0A0R0F963_SOYBN|nr:uncharacterized protein LOC114395368 [Glycine soja]KAG4920711.1 hypothetical protein JHK86_049524 [Glycine max]KAG4935368.1 hypothetical protein JHK85_050287 [Glycine max]KAG5090879.1 hypothetical protein JHK82_049657 [Glycine max]KAH1153714.1 hypothetical protein GYH30_049373 [Glycine max]KRG98516.1 hypothetical protein GLYMA_18G078100v4 [Glycine max]|eukprot:XP_025982713.1 uncharacterized protein LOC100781118 [Glycine max]
MEIQQQLLKFRYHIGVALLVSLSVFSVLHFAPRFLNILAYFWPLFLSTALFLALVLFFAKTQTSLNSDASLPKPAEELLDFVAGHHHDPPLDAHKSD